MNSIKNTKPELNTEPESSEHRELPDITANEMPDIILGVKENQSKKQSCF